MTAEPAVGSVQRRIEARITEVFHPVALQVINESRRHKVPPGSESHFKIILLSEAFNGLRSLQRHQAVYRALGEIMEEIHALALHTWTPQEWAEQHNVVPDTPDCLGRRTEPHRQKKRPPIS